MSESNENEIPGASGSDKVGIISMQDFLNFLKVASSFNDSIENGGKGSSKHSFSYDQLAKNDLVNNLMRKYKAWDKTDTVSKESEDLESIKKKEVVKRRRSLQKSVSLKSKFDCDVNHKLNPNLTNKLDEVLNEGILDSFLPFICQTQQSNLAKATTSAVLQTPIVTQSITASTSSANINQPKTTKPLINSQTGKQSQQLVLNMSGDKKGGSTSSEFSSYKNIRKKSVSPIVLDSGKESEPELTIHVCDEVKNISRDFTCPQKLLISKMGYFAEITNGQKLSEMDISVHCDLEIFDWLIKWVKRDSKSSDYWPKLDPSNVVPILVSASFLQMEPLLLECLSFCHARLSEVIKISPNLACLNDNIITRLADLFTNLELEMVKDKKDRIIPRLWTKLIQSLCEDPQALRGHYATLASLYRCIKCGKFLTQSVSSYVHCISSNMKINRWGQIISTHVRDVNWSLTNYVSNLYKELRSWRKVYWRLWGMCHFLYCVSCETHFPACQMQW